MYLKHVFSLKKSRRHLSKTILSSFFVSFFFFSFNQMSSATIWYRYYDRQGVPTISTSISPEHIRYGYDVINNNMETIRQVPALQNTEIARQKKEKEAEQEAIDNRMQQIYTHSSIAQKRKRNLLRGIQDQISLQRKQYDSLQDYLRDLRGEEFSILYDKKTVPKSLKDSIEDTNYKIARSQKKVTDLQAQYQQTEQQYDKIIARLKKLEEH
ncbi:hypothetical protein P256_02052 [Acinetobacter nectaris CIP 110549]|uniref:DUF4124 domain-containing protein n=2 Tax=Acinetobacter nectaris TaxID=1219382 RepID=V2T6N9_9GAMM|nr:hypothetical protein P256_02052 [Acinetobacter nectaris CIP 110549]